MAVCRVPSNVRFVVDDASELDWLYPPDTFDFIHTRTMLGSFEEFRAIIKRAFTYIKPGGWMESQVRDKIFPSNTKGRQSGSKN